MENAETAEVDGYDIDYSQREGRAMAPSSEDYRTAGHDMNYNLIDEEVLN